MTKLVIFFKELLILLYSKMPHWSNSVQESHSELLLRLGRIVP